MKFAIALLALFATQPSFAASTDTRVTCTATTCRDVEPPSGGGSWCGDVDATPFQLDLMNFKPSQNGKTLKFAPGDGDQYTLFVLNIADAAALQPGDGLTGSVSDAYWWADGDHTRSTTDMNCSKN